MLVFAGRGDADEGEWIGMGFAVPGRVDHPSEIGFKTVPVAKMRFQLQTDTFETRQVGLERQRLVVGFERLVMTPCFHEHVGATAPCLDQVGLEGERPLLRGERFVGAAQLEQHIAKTKPRPSQIGVECAGLVVGGKRFVEALQLQQRKAATEPGVGQIGLELQCALAGGERLIIALQFLRIRCRG